MSQTIFMLRADCDEVLLDGFSSRERAEEVRKEIAEETGWDEDDITIAERRIDPTYIPFFGLKLKEKNND